MLGHWTFKPYSYLSAHYIWILEIPLTIHC
jgi:hypothetical protein